MNSGTKQFPRQLTSQEKYLLFSILPEEKPGYKYYREKIDELMVTGYGRFNNNNFILGKENTIPDLSFASTPVFTAGTIITPGDEIDILINEELDDEIEIDLAVKNAESIPDEIKEQGKWSYSEWNPGDKSPGDKEGVREVVISKNKYVLVFAPSHKKIWLHENESGVNHLIPITNYYNELMRFKRIKDPNEALNPRLMFQKQDDFTDNDLINALVLYNKYLRRFSIDFSKYLDQEVQIKSPKSIKDLFRKAKN